ncbi:MAG: anthranilate synthase component I family protein [Actinomycetes bacterium]|jgi:anthranilate synthase component 1|nr:MAG: anthranilate synthase component I [Actinomycetota bacterium]
MQPPFDITADLDTPVSAYLKLRPFGPRFLLESVEKAERLARYSFIGFGGGLDLEIRRDRVVLVGVESPPPASRDGWLSLMRKALELSPRLEPAIDAVPFTGGLVGAAGYDTVRHFERLPGGHEGDGTPEAVFFAPRSLLVFDHLTRRAALLHSGTETERQELRSAVIEALAGPVRVPSGGTVTAPVSTFPEGDFLAAVDRVKDHIAAGDAYQVVLSQRFEGHAAVDPFQVYRGLRLLNPSPYMFFFESGDLAIAGSSPETLVGLDRGEARLRPIAGTRRRGADPEEDRALEEDLLADPKENAEHVMLVDLARNDVGRVAEPGSVVVDPYKSIERYSHVMHMVSGVRGRLRAGMDAFDLFAAVFPAGTLVGAPKVRAMEIIDDLEPVGRALYGGTVGYFANNGNMDHAITIRTVVFHGDRYSFQAGAGIVADSVAEKEHQEVLAKSAILRQALELAGEGL